MENKKIIITDLILILGSLFFIAGIVGYTQPRIIAPLNNYSTYNGNVLFEFKNAEKILIDDNLDFTSPTEVFVKDGIEVNLIPGNYYWKIVGFTESEVRQFTIESEVDLRINEKNSGDYEVVNAGNVKLNVDVYSEGVFTGKVVLNPDETNSRKGDKFIGGQNEE